MRRTWALRRQLERGWGLPVRGLPPRSPPPSRVASSEGSEVSAGSQTPAGNSLWHSSPSAPLPENLPSPSGPAAVVLCGLLPRQCRGVVGSWVGAPACGPQGDAVLGSGVGSEVLFPLCAQGLGREHSGYSSVSRISRVYGRCCGHRWCFENPF